jgi:hypothetical protein
MRAKRDGWDPYFLLTMSRYVVSIAAQGIIALVAYLISLGKVGGLVPSLGIDVLIAGIIAVGVICGLS